MRQRNQVSSTFRRQTQAAQVRRMVLARFLLGEVSDRMTDTYKQCAKCQQRPTHAGWWHDKFCSKCGGERENITPIPYTGEPDTKGIYRIVIDVEYEFRNIVHAQESAGKSMLGEKEIKFIDIKRDAVQVSLSLSTVTPATHPYVCRYCRDEYHRAHPDVSPTTEGRCEVCNKQDWVKRVEKAEDAKPKTPQCLNCGMPNPPEGHWESCPEGK